MIISRTPFRISFAGGYSDLKDFYSANLSGGAVVSVSIDKYVYLTMHKLFHSNKIHLKYSTNEFVNNVSDIQHPIIREVFKEFNISGVDFNSSADVPSGTGLGSSSSFTTGLINLCSAFIGKFLSKEEIASLACDIEINRVGAPIGKQDQYAAAVGGLNFIQFNSDESVSVERLLLSCERMKELEDSLLLFYLGSSRSASSILAKQRDTSNPEIVSKMADLARELRDELKRGNIDNFGPILHKNWQYKKELSSLISNYRVDTIYRLALKWGATGGKLLGAGETGFMLLCVPLSFQDQLRKALCLYELHFKFDRIGSSIIY